MRKRPMVDLSSLRNIYTGLGQIALSYGNYFKNNYHSHSSLREVGQELQLHGKECKVIYNKVPLLDESKASKPRFNIIQPFFFTLGVVIKRKKNFHVLLDLMKLIPEKNLYIIGRGADEKRNDYALNIKKRIKAENITNVTLHAPISCEEKIWMYSHCEAFLFPSLSEGFGIPIIEAMQSGKPVFSSKETRLKETGATYAYFGDNFKQDSMKQLIDTGLKEFYNNPGLAKNEKTYTGPFPGDQHFQYYEEIYRTI